jgi:hypothetical protein
MSDSVFLYFTTLFLLLFFAVGSILGWFVREYLASSEDTGYKKYLHPEFFDRNGNFIDGELLSVHIEDEEENYDED